MVFQLVYYSRSVKLMQQTELLDLLETARLFNQLHGITGMLLYKDKSFLQLLEGSQEDVLGLYKKICHDRRHFEVSSLMQHTVQRRTFDAWSMGFQNLDVLDSQPIQGYSPFMSPHFKLGAFSESADKAVALLKFFRAKS